MRYYPAYFDICVYIYIIYAFLYILLIKVINFSSVQAGGYWYSCWKQASKECELAFSAGWNLLWLRVFPCPFNVLQKPHLKICSFLSLTAFSILLGLLLKLQYKAHKEIKWKNLKIPSDCWAKPAKLRNSILLEYIDVLGVVECRSSTAQSENELRSQKYCNWRIIHFHAKVGLEHYFNTVKIKCLLEEDVLLRL